MHPFTITEWSQHNFKIKKKKNSCNHIALRLSRFIVDSTKGEQSVQYTFHWRYFMCLLFY